MARSIMFEQTTKDGRIRCLAVIPRRRPCASAAALLLLCLSAPAAAQTGDEKAKTEESKPDQAADESVAEKPKGGETAPSSDEQSDKKQKLAAAKKQAENQRAADESAKEAAEVAALERRLATLEKAKEAADVAALTAGSETEVQKDPLRVYGFFDTGFQKVWANPTSPVANFLPGSNSASFVIGNLNVYFDAQPVPDWRGLVEVRFTNAPHGNINSPGGFGYTFDRSNTQQIDPHAAAPNAPMWGGYTVIERAWIEWNHFQFAKVRVGNFFTPWGIWNIDHGTPTLLALSLPQFILQEDIPIRQTGIQIHGNTFVGDWELAYNAYVSNGRQSLSNFDFDDDKGFGLRLAARYQGTGLTAQIGGSGYYGNYENEIVEITNVSPLAFEKRQYAHATEAIAGLDLSLDIFDNTRLRAEWMVRYTKRDDGELPEADVILSGPNAFSPSRYSYHAYVVAAHRLPWFGLEPYLYVQGSRNRSSLGEYILVTSAGLNIHITAATKIKTEYGHAFFLDPASTVSGTDVSRNNLDSFYTRLVMAF